MADLNRVTPEQTPRQRQRETGHTNKNPHYPYGEPDYGEGYKYDKEFKGPVKKRGCTDVLCLILFLAFIGGWAFVAYVAVSQGDIDKVTNSRHKCFLTHSLTYP